VKPRAMFRPRRTPRIAGLSLNRMIPNILTLLALCAGLTAIRFGLQAQWQQAVVSIVAAAILDGLDGRIARLLRGTSKFGAELDSLSDFVSFGVAPSLLLYLWSMHNAGGFGWAMALLFSVCCALRLARFNTMIGVPDLPPWAYNFFTGVPAPAAAGVVLIPMVLSFETGPGYFDRPAVVSLFLAGVSFLMVSAIPTFSFKGGRIPLPAALPLLLIACAVAAFLVTEPWYTLGALGLVYLGVIPVSWRSFRRLKEQAEHLRSSAVPQNESDTTVSISPVEE